MSSERERALFSLLATAWLWGKYGDEHEELSEEDQTACFTAVKALMEVHGQDVETVGEADENQIQINSGYGAMTGRPFVHVVLGAPDVQVRPEKAREMGFMLFDAASHAEMDGTIVRFLTEKLNVPREKAAQLMVSEFRPLAEESRLRDLADHQPSEQPVAERLDDARGGIAPMNRAARRRAARTKANRG